jgi:hypothetical protein
VTSCRCRVTVVTVLGDPGSAFGSPVDSETTAELKDHVHLKPTDSTRKDGQ